MNSNKFRLFLSNIEIGIHSERVCPYCGGSGYDFDGGQCPECGGLGEVD